VGNILTNANAALGPEQLQGVELGLNHAVGSRLSWQATAYWDRVDDPIANVTLTSTPALITRQRQNLGRARVRGINLDADYQPAAAVRIRASYLLSDARVMEFPPTPAIEDNLLPQVPRHRANLRFDYLNSKVFNASLRARYESHRFDDDQNLLRLDSLFVMDVSLDRALGDSWGAFLSVENLFDQTYPVQATPVELLGTPFTVTAGLRFDLRRP
jgi:outer membrane receptor protein involved in Fe transport